MLQSTDNGIKNRLTEPSAMIAEVKRLLTKGVAMDQIALELSKQFYIDIDLLNAVLRAMRKKMTSGKMDENGKAQTSASIGDKAAA
ncbi:hypothetical protein A33O_04413 [Nitratireductor aquibiodomus RA22]|uniref:Uncharacterized protein n=1 Tax=Nitratireductor aquibiodomus RA22 TaxID=1189611 RepID=I5C4S2_9HYPH|nr:hypothetical protein [Nitratireductor aquibiodomus]EIM76824.1 hypothetical protein A33O_04413 [Nitratireductor aquibiodomus RA22]